MTSPHSTHTYVPVGPGDFLIVATPSDYHCDFACYDCVAFEVSDDGQTRTPCFEKVEDAPSPEWVSDIRQASVYLSGSIKWDGCANLHFDGQERCMLHFCGREDAGKVGRLIDRLYDIAAELIPKWDAGVAA